MNPSDMQLIRHMVEATNVQVLMYRLREAAAISEEAYGSFITHRDDMEWKSFVCGIASQSENCCQILRELYISSGHPSPVAVLTSGSHVQTIDKYKNVLYQCTSVDSLTLAYLLSNGSVTREFHDVLEGSDKSMRMKAVMLYSYLSMNSEETFHKFLDSICAAEQKHIQDLLMEKTGDPPLSNQHLTRLTIVRPVAMSRIDSVDDVFDLMLRAKSPSGDFALSKCNRDRIRRDLPNYERTRELLDAIERRTEFSFLMFCEALKDLNKKRLYDALNEGVVVSCTVNTNVPSKEDALVTAWNQENMEVEESHFQDLQMMMCQKEKSLRLYFYCKAPASLSHYIEMQRTGCLKSMVRQTLQRYVHRMKCNDTVQVSLYHSADDRNTVSKWEDVYSKMDGLVEREFLFLLRSLRRLLDEQDNKCGASVSKGNLPSSHRSVTF